MKANVEDVIHVYSLYIGITPVYVISLAASSQNLTERYFDNHLRN